MKKTVKKNNWQTKKLGDICDLIKGKKPKTFSKIGKPYLTAKSIRGSKKPQLTEESKNIVFVKLEDVVIIMDGSNSGEIFQNLDGVLASTMGISNFDKEKIDAKFLLYFLIGYREEFTKSRTGSAIPHLNKDQFNDLLLPIISLDEQKRIVGILDGVFGDMKKAKENAEKNFANAKELFESYLQSIFENTGENWEEKKLGDKKLLQIIDGDRGKNYPKKSDFSQKGYCLFLNTKNVRLDGFDFQTVVFITKKKDDVLGNGKLQRDDVLLTTRGTIGNIAVYNKSVNLKNIRINSGMLIFRPNTRLIIPEYLFKIFQSGIMKSQIRKYVSGAAQPQLPIKTLVNFSIPVPKSLTAQKQIVKKLDELSAETKRLEGIYQQKIDDLEELKKSVLKEAFEGKL